ncbi:hypothetical protein G6F46_015051 [Rhizopus delemar]|nr:hypothetical protein G6F46_015051 [Rhizopus delemar]
MRNTRLPVSLNEATWIITDSVSITNTPPMITSTSSWRVITAIVPSTAPSASAPSMASHRACRITSPSLCASTPQLCGTFTPPSMM